MGRVMVMFQRTDGHVSKDQSNVVSRLDCVRLGFNVSSPDPLLMDCPDYSALTPSYQLPKKKFNLLEEEEQEGMRMCHSCNDLISRYVFHDTVVRGGHVTLKSHDTVVRGGHVTLKSHDTLVRGGHVTLKSHDTVVRGGHVTLKSHDTVVRGGHVTLKSHASVGYRRTSLCHHFALLLFLVD